MNIQYCCWRVDCTDIRTNKQMNMSIFYVSIPSTKLNAMYYIHTYVHTYQIIYNYVDRDMINMHIIVYMYILSLNTHDLVLKNQTSCYKQYSEKCQIYKLSCLKLCGYPLNIAYTLIIAFINL